MGSSDLQPQPNSALAAIEGQQRRPEEFLQFLRENIDVNDLLKSRPAQAALAKILDDHFSRNKEYIRRANNQGLTSLLNPYPILELKRDNATSFVHDGFMLKDGQFYYYVPHWNPGDDIPPFLRPEDVVPSKTYTQTFPAEVRQRIMHDLHITEEQFRYFVYVQDSRITSHAVMQDIPFNKPFCRVAINGGESERYNYNTQAWEPSGDGVYKPPMTQRLKNLLTQPGPAKHLSPRLLN